MKFPARGLAIAIWIVAAALVAIQQYTQPFLFKGMFSSGAALLPVMNSLSHSIIYGGSIAAIGAIVHLLGEIRDLTARAKPKVQ